MPSIKLMNDNASFSDATVTATTVGDLRTELELSPNATVNVNGSISSNGTTVSDGDFVAAVTSNKTGGNVK